MNKLEHQKKLKERQLLKEIIRIDTRMLLFGVAVFDLIQPLKTLLMGLTSVTFISSITVLFLLSFEFNKLLQRLTTLKTSIALIMFYHTFFLFVNGLTYLIYGISKEFIVVFALLSTPMMLLDLNIKNKINRYIITRWPKPYIQERISNTRRRFLTRVGLVMTVSAGMLGSLSQDTTVLLFYILLFLELMYGVWAWNNYISKI